nr:cytochrome c oxidase subunit III [Notomastus sp. GK-2021]
MPRQPFHIVDPSPWPATTAMNATSLATGVIDLFYGHSPTLLMVGGTLLLMSLACWWRDVIRESTFMGHHTSYVARGLRLGFILFLVSEIMFFFGFFWAFFHSALSPTPEIGCTWPPVGIEPINPFALPLVNTALLLSSGVSLTWAHHALLASQRAQALIALSITILLGILFTILQAKEYYDAPFTIADGIYGSLFFIMTGFHGLHVIMGTIFLLVNCYRTFAHHFSCEHHLGFEFGAWYWHFVDVIWILLYLCLYWWGR